ncbi:hypothetical protein PVAP13_1KG365400 [Panicum virgatum]|uniref:Protein HHL1, chloroplastic n=1 Tax=Panicum virgatum TaxID=38727 RepID=A0A8T0XDK0_PANVG|nr:hypothetical protein PVAP13_1KG365400 [Panicum virgatum]
MEVVGGVSLRPPSAQGPARIGQLSSVDVAGRLVLRAAPRRQPATARRALVVEARGGRSWSERQMLQQRRAPQLPKVEDDGNPRFVIFIRTANVYFWYPLNVITGGTTAKIMLAAKDNFLGKYIYKDTLARNLAAVIYKDEDEIIDTAKAQYRVLKTENEFRYGYKVNPLHRSQELLKPKKRKQKAKKRSSAQRDERSSGSRRSRDSRRRNDCHSAPGVVRQVKHRLKFCHLCPGVAL